MAAANRNIKLVDFGYAKQAKRRTSWLLNPNGPRSVDDLRFVRRDTAGRANWWAVTPPDTDYWSAHATLGRAYAFDLLDLMNNPDGECPEHILAYIASSMIPWMATVSPGAGEAIPHGFFQVLSEYMTTGEVSR